MHKVLSKTQTKKIIKKNEWDYDEIRKISLELQEQIYFSNVIIVDP